MAEPAPLTFLCLAGYEKGQEFLRELKRQGQRVILITASNLQEADWPRESLDDIFFLPDMYDLNAMINGVSYLARTHRFDRLRRKVTIEAKGLWKSEVREIPFESIADVVVEKAGRKNPPSLYVYYVMRDGERIRWAESYDGAKEETLECASAAREVLGLAPGA